MASTRMVPAVRIDETRLIYSNVIEELPLAETPNVFIDAWNPATAYAIGNTTCTDYQCNLMPNGVSFVYTAIPFFIVWTGTYAAGAGRAPGLGFDEFGNYLPGHTAWTTSPRNIYTKWIATQKFAKGAVCGKIGAGGGRLFQSLIADNLGNDPDTSPDKWRASSTSYAVHSMSATYKSDERVVEFSGTEGVIWESRSNGNVGHAPATSPLWWQAVGKGYKHYDPGAVYSKGQIVTDPETNHLFEWLIDQPASPGPAITGKPLNDEDHWFDIGPTNRFAMFDDYNSEGTEWPEKIEVVVQHDKPVDTVALLTLSAKEVQVIATRPDGSEEFNQTYQLPSIGGVVTPWRHMMTPILRPSFFATSEIPPYPDLTIRVIVRDPGRTVKVGTMVHGLARYIGDLQSGPETSIKDFSTTDTNPISGKTTTVLRPHAKTARWVLKVAGDESDQADAVFDLLSQYISRPALFLGSGRFSTTAIFGSFSNLNHRIDGSEEKPITTVSLDLTGLT